MVNQLKILVIDDDAIMRDACRETLIRDGHDIDMADGGSQGLSLLGRWAYDVVLLDLRMPDIDGMTVLDQMRERYPDTVVIVISGQGSVSTVVRAMKLGAFDFLAKPFTPMDLRRTVNKARDKRQLFLENAYLKQELERRTGPTRIVGQSPALNRVMQMLDRLAPTDTTVLLTGESGTGKGLMARRLHDLSTRKNNPFVAVDCSTLVPTLFESELFGHAKGAFTGADSSKIGKFQLSNGGTLFLDEVGNISLDIQAKLLKAVEDRSICKVGSNRVIRVDTRLVTATNRDLAQEVKKGSFREDLFYRLNVMNLHLPPLREHSVDIPDLADYFLERFRHLGNARVRGFTPGALKELIAYHWPGNVRELQNTIQRILILANTSQVDRDQVRTALPIVGLDGNVDESLTLADMERKHILKTLRTMGGHRSRTALALGIDRKTLRQKIIKYQLDA